MDASQLSSNLLGDVEVTGSISFKGELTFDGKLTGPLIEGRTLILGEHSEITANITAQYLTISGVLRGDVNVSEKCQLKPTARFEGNLKTSRLVMEDGATFIGRSEITPKNK